MFRTDLGLRIRAVLTDRNMAEAVGIDTVRTGQTVFVLARRWQV